METSLPAEASLPASCRWRSRRQGGGQTVGGVESVFTKIGGSCLVNATFILGGGNFAKYGGTGQIVSKYLLLTTGRVESVRLLSGDGLVRFSVLRVGSDRVSKKKDQRATLKYHIVMDWHLRLNST